MSAKTLDEYVSQISKDFFRIRNTSVIKTVENFEVLDTLKIEPYLNIIRSNAVLVTLDEEDILKYKYKPQLLSQVIYGTENLYYLILLLNNMTVEEFIPKDIYLLTASNRTLIEDIINKENKSGT